jgi:hypothetical protein
MRHSKTWLGAWLAGALGTAALPFACASVDNAVGTGDCDAPVDGVCPAAGAAGLGGSGGASGVGGGGTGGAPMMGAGGGGTGGTAGAGPCTSDAACAADKGAGSLCVGDACTKATGACDATLLVVVAPGREPDDAALGGACHFRDLDGAREAIGPTTTRLAVYADSASSTEALEFTKAASLEGHHSDTSKAVPITLPQAATTPLVRFAEGGTLKGVALGGGVATAVRHESGTLSIAGPTTLANAALALELVGSAAATVTGTESAPVRLSGNKRGIVVPTDATLSMQGDGKVEGLVVEGTNGGGAAVFFDVATTAGGCSTLSKVTLRDNTGSDLANGNGAIEVRKGRQVVVDDCTFVHNTRSVTFGGGGNSEASDFLNVHLENNDFADALPTTPNTGSVLCGDDLGSNTQLRLRANNAFPNSQDCDALGDNSSPNCGIGQVFSHNGVSNVVRACETNTCQCVGSTAQCGGL